MKLRITLAALTAVSVCALSAAQAQTSPPTPRPAAGALPNPNPNAVQRTFRTQAPDEQRSSATSEARDISGRVAVRSGGTPPTPRPAAGALPNPNANAVQKSFRTQAPDEQQSSSAAQPRDPGASGRSR